MTAGTLERAAPVDQAPPELRPTLGPLVCRWIEKNLVHAEGDYFGKPFKLRPWQRAFVYQCYELLEDGRRAYDAALFGLPKGNGKTEIAAAIGLAELAGPVVFNGWTSDGKPRGRRQITPDIPVAAASFDQADLLFGAAATMLKHGPLANYFEIYETEILIKGAPGRMYRVAAVAGTNDGAKPTFVLCDEVHEWTGKKETVHKVLSNNRAKRSGAWELNISTAGWDMRSLLGRMYQRGKRKREKGAASDPRFLFVWYEPPPIIDEEGKEQPAPRSFDDRAALEAAIRASNPACDDFMPMRTIIDKVLELEEHDARRYRLNQWVNTPQQWLATGAWDGRALVREAPEAGADVVIGFDGSYSGDSTAVVGAIPGPVPHLFVIGAWEKPEAAEGEQGKIDWTVDILDVEETVRQACATWNVLRIGCDPYRWQRSMAVLLDEGLPVIEWPSHQPARMVPACASFRDGVRDATLTHDGDERLAEHVGNCHVRIDSRGPRISKDHKDSARHIDLAVAAVIAHDLALRVTQEGGGWGLA